jgi:hypothetical protein
VAALLFLIAGYPSDAHEVASLVTARGDDTVARQRAVAGDVAADLVLDVLDLARGDLASVLRDAPPSLNDLPVEERDPAVLLWDRLRAGVSCARGCPSRTDRRDPAPRRDFRAIFAAVADQAVTRLDAVQNDTLQRLLAAVAASDPAIAAKAMGRT